MSITINIENNIYEEDPKKRIDFKIVIIKSSGDYLTRDEQCRIRYKVEEELEKIFFQFPIDKLS